MKNGDIWYLIGGAALLYVFFDVKKIKRHPYIPAKMDAHININNAVSMGLETIQVGQTQAQSLDLGQTDPHMLIDVLASLGK